MALEGIRLVTFDATNTLLRFKVQPWQYYTNIGRSYGFTGSEKDLKPRLLESYNVMWQKYPNFGKNTISWEKWWTEVVKATFDGHLPQNTDVNSLATDLINDFKTTKCWCLSEGGAEILNIIRKYGISLGVISNFDPRLVEILHSVKIYNKFEFILTSFDLGYTKPDRKIFDHALKLCQNVSPSECLHIGDDLEKDFQAAKQAGWHALLVTNKMNNTKCVKREHVFKNLKELHIVIYEEKLQL